MMRSDMWSDIWLVLGSSYQGQAVWTRFWSKMTTRVLKKLDRRCHPKKTIKARFEGIKRTYTTMFNVNTYDLPKPGFSIIIYAVWIIQYDSCRRDWLTGGAAVPKTLMIIVKSSKWELISQMQFDWIEKDSKQIFVQDILFGIRKWSSPKSFGPKFAAKKVFGFAKWFL